MPMYLSMLYLTYKYTVLHGRDNLPLSTNHLIFDTVFKYMSDKKSLCLTPVGSTQSGTNNVAYDM